MSKFAPKEPVQLAEPQTRIFSKEELSKHNGVDLPFRYIAIKGTVFDVTHNEAAYGPTSKYNALVGRDASRALGKSSLNKEDTDISVSDDISLLTDRQLQVLDDWFSFFSQRYNVMGTVAK